MDPLVLVALIGAPANLLVGWAAYRKARSADNAVNHRVNGSTISQDIADIRRELRVMHKDIIWLSRWSARHLREEHGYGSED